MYRRAMNPLTTLLTILTVSALAACGGGTSAGPSTGPSTEPSTEASSPASPAASAGESTAAGSVAVALQEFAVLPDPTSTSAGSVTFDVTNSSSALPHELVVIRTDLGAADLPTKEDGSVDESGEGVEVIGEVEELDPGATGAGTVELEAGNYVLICNIFADGIAHYDSGMRIDFVVN